MGYIVLQYVRCIAVSQYVPLVVGILYPSQCLGCRTGSRRRSIHSGCSIFYNSRGHTSNQLAPWKSLEILGDPHQESQDMGRFDEI